MANASDYLEQQIFNHIFRNDTFSKPGNVFIGLTKDVPLDDGTYTEIDGTAYARYAGASGDAIWGVHSDTASNSVEFSFPTAGSNWGVVSGVVITDAQAPSGGNVLLHGELTSPKTVETGDVFRFGVGDLDITIA
jgi:hypothetical protein